MENCVDQERRGYVSQVHSAYVLAPKRASSKVVEVLVLPVWGGAGRIYKYSQREEILSWRGKMWWKFVNQINCYRLDENLVIPTNMSGYAKNIY